MQAILFYVVEFYRKGLTDVATSRRYYDFLSQSQLESEARLLFAEWTRILPFSLMMPRCYSLFYELLERATCSPHLSDAERTRVVLLAINAKEELLLRVPRSTHAETAEAIRRHCHKVERMGRFKRAAQLILNSNTKFAGPIRPAGGRVVHAQTRSVH